MDTAKNIKKVQGKLPLAELHILHICMEKNIHSYIT